MNSAGIIFSNIHDKSLPELTKTRTVAAIPFLCRYRLIDFALSNMVNSDIWNIGVIAHSNYHSLMEHIGSGKDFDLARRSGGVKILPPYITSFAGERGLYRTRLEALIGVYPYISAIKEELVVLSDCNTVCNVDLRELISEHVAAGADITVAVAEHGARFGNVRGIAFRADSGGVVRDVLEGTVAQGSDTDPGLNIMVMSSELLSYLVSDAAAHGYTSFTRDILLRGLRRYSIRIWRMSGYSALISSLSDYYSVSTELIHDKVARDELFLPDRPIYTRRRNSPPTRYECASRAKSSLIADGCTVRGRVEDSVLFRGVKVGENAVVRNSIIMQDTVIGDNVTLDHVICDKNVLIRDGRVLSGCDGTPFCIPKGHIA